MIDKIKDLILQHGALTDSISEQELNSEKESFFYYIVEGEVDLFLTEEIQDHRTGALMFFVSFPSNSFILTKLPLKDYKKWHLQAKFSPGTKLIAVPFASMKKLMQQPEFKREAEQLIEYWVTTLTQSINTILKPGNLDLLKESNPVELKTDTAYVNETNSLLWIKTLNGNVTFMGNGFDNKNELPLMQNGWISSDNNAAIDIYSIERLIDETKLLDCLQSFYQTILGISIQNIKKLTNIEEEQFQQGIKDRSLKLDAALKNISNFYGEMEEVLSFEGAASGAKAASQLIAKTLGVNLIIPKEFPVHYNDKALVNYILDNSQIRRREVALSGNWWEETHGPLIAFLQESQEAVVLLFDKKTGYQLIKPATGEKIIIDSSISQTLAPFAISVYRSLPNHSMGLKDIIYWSLKNHANELKLIIIISIFSGMIGLFTPWATGQLFSVVIPDSSYSLLTQLIAGMLAVTLGYAFFEMARSFTLARIMAFIDNSGVAGIWDKMTRLPISFFKNYGAGDLLNRASGFQVIVNQLFGVAASSLFDSVYGFFYFLLLFYYSLTLSFISLGLLIFMGGVTFFILKKYITIQRVTANLSGQLSSLLTEYISGIQKVKTTASESYIFNNWSIVFVAYRKALFRAQLWSNVLISFNSIFPIVATIIIFLMAAPLIQEKLLGLGGFLAFNAAFGSLIAITLRLTGTLGVILQLVPTFERLKPILDTPPEVHAVKRDPGIITGNIEVDHLHFRYNQTSPLVLKDVSFKVAPGEFVAIVGASGSGKSTLLRLLLQFETPASGSIFFDNQSLNYLDINMLRRQIGVVLQNSSLFPGSIFDNIIGSAPLSIEDAWVAARHAGFDKDINMMPMGMHTLISEGSGGLSGGQKQRLLIARALVNRPSLLFFDEATSALDNETQHIVTESLNQLNATRIIIAHRLSTIIKADKIIVLVDGAVEEIGGYKELMAKKGAFYKIASRQIA